MTEAGPAPRRPAEGRPSSGGSAKGALEGEGNWPPPPPGEPWTVLHLVRWSGRYLEGKGAPEGRLDAEHLLADVLQLGRLELYLAHDRPVADAELRAFKERLRRRARREPLQHILGTVPFRDLLLGCDSRALVPRPETEELVEAVLERMEEWQGTEPLRALDVGTGSGAIALALAREGPFQEVVATEPDPAALELARENARRNGLQERVTFRPERAFQSVESGEAFDVVVSNPPYVAEGEWEGLEPEVRDWDPRKALVAGPTGLEVLDELVDGVAPVLRPGGLLALEVGAGQASRVRGRLEASGAFGSVGVRRDAAGIGRMVLAERVASAWVPRSLHDNANQDDGGS